jgi:hypothetical protein
MAFDTIEVSELSQMIGAGERHITACDDKPYSAAPGK